MPRNPAYYGLNASRPWPLDDSATLTDDDGEILPDDILVGATFCYPRSIWKAVYLTAVTVSPRLCTLAFALAEDRDAAPSQFRPLAVVQAVRPVPIFVPLPIQPAEADLDAGWVVLGPGANGVSYSGRFSTPAQSRLLPSCARPYHNAPVPWIGKRGLADRLSGVVELAGGGDLQLSVEDDVKISFDPYDPQAHAFSARAIVARLGSAPGVARNVLELYTGPCGGRPESGTCLRPSVRSLGGAVPDCDGTLTLRLRGATATPFTGNRGGFVIDMAASLAAACAAASDSAIAGHAFDDGCSESSSDSPDDGSSSDAPEAAGGCARPYTAALDTGDNPPAGWRVVSGTWAAVAAGEIAGFAAGAWAATHAGLRNVAVCDELRGCGPDASLNRRVSVALSLQPGVQANGGVVINRNADGTYYLACLNAVTSSLDLWYDDGRSIGLLGAAFLPFDTPVRVGPWYALSVESRELFDGRGELTLVAQGLSDPGFPTTTLVMPVDRLGDASGQPGLGTIRARARFSTFLVEDL